MQTLTLSVARWLSGKVSTLTEARFIAPESALKRNRRARAVYAAHRLRDTTLTSPERLRLGRPTASRHQVGHSRGTSRSTMRGWSTCFTTSSVPPCQGDGTSLIATSKNPRRASPPRTPRRRCLFPISAVDLCHRNPNNRPALEPGACALSTLATCLEPRLRHACTERDTNRPRRRWLAVAGITSLEWWIGLVPISPAVAWEAPTFRRRPVSGRSSHGRFQPLCEPRRPNHWCLLSRTERALVAQSSSVSREPFPHAMHQTPQLPRPGDPFHPPILSALLACARSDRADNVSYPSLAALAWRSTRVHTQ